MPRNMINEVLQLAPEVTPGTLLAATKRFSAVNVTGDDQNEFSQIDVQGRKYGSGFNKNKQWMEWGVEGAVNFNELPYFLCSLVRSVTPTALTGTETGAYQWDWNPDTFAPETVQSYTFERGYPGSSGERNAYNLMTGLELAADRDDFRLSGGFRGRQLIYPFIVTDSGVADIPDVRAFPGDLDAYMDTTSGGLGGTKLTTAYGVTWRLNDRRGVAWPINSALDSWGSPVETRPTPEYVLVLEDDATCRQIMDYAESRTTSWHRFTATGPTIAGSAAYLLRIDMPLRVKGIGAQQDVDGVTCREITFGMVHDPTWAKAYAIRVVNTLAAL